jgi:hypothetical protein
MNKTKIKHRRMKIAAYGAAKHQPGSQQKAARDRAE